MWRNFQPFDVEKKPVFHIMTTRLQRVDEIISRFARGVMSFLLVWHTWGASRARYSTGIVVSLVTFVKVF
jgi:hypothetical protein